MCDAIVWALLLLMALLLLGGFWFFRRPVHPQAPCILGIDEVWLHALGESCATPEALSRATTTANCLLERLQKAGIARLPEQVEVQSWIQQARLIMAGDYAGLRALQARRYQAFERDARWVIAAAIVMLIDLLLMLLCPAPEGPPCHCASQQETIYVPTDMLFDYNKAVLRSAEKLKATLQSQLANYQSVTIESIKGFADPIGGYCHNDDLASRRAQSVSKALIDMPLGFKGKPPTLNDPSVQGNYLHFEDRSIWETCFAEYQTTQPAEHWPLKARDPDEVCDRSPAKVNALSQPWPTVNLAELNRGSRNDIAERARNQRDLIGCLAPMRRVEIQITGELAQEATNGR